MPGTHAAHGSAVLKTAARCSAVDEGLVHTRIPRLDPRLRACTRSKHRWRRAWAAVPPHQGRLTASEAPLGRAAPRLLGLRLEPGEEGLDLVRLDLVDGLLGQHLRRALPARGRRGVLVHRLLAPRGALLAARHRRHGPRRRRGRLVARGGGLARGRLGRGLVPPLVARALVDPHLLSPLVKAHAHPLCGGYLGDDARVRHLHHRAAAGRLVLLLVHDDHARVDLCLRRLELRRAARRRGWLTRRRHLHPLRRKLAE
mmetsp:Transcript_31665/g.103455  ORF Transcript_31665/g.103455 Transcript_31665/m.103455 type:complete len:257 (+) Transcript_31665:927-1697(+)